MKILLSILIIFIYSQYGWSNSIHDSTHTEIDSLCLIEDNIDKITNECMGVTYKWGGESLKGFDCSGLVRYVFLQLGINIPHSSRAIAKMGAEIKIEDAQKGDIIIFTGYKDRNNIGHVGIILQNEPENLTFIHSSSAPKNNGVVKTNYYQSNYPKRFIKIIRIQ